MKKQMLIMMALCIASLCANTQNLGGSDRIIKIEELNQQKIDRFSQGKLGDHILECSEGTCLPLKMDLKGEFLALESSNAAPLYLKLLKTCYIRCEEKENFLFSTDLQNWKEFSEFFTGHMRVSLQAGGDEIIAGLELDLNQRKL